MCEIKAVSGSTNLCKRKFVRPSVYLEMLHFVNMLFYGNWSWAPDISLRTSQIFQILILFVSFIPLLESLHLRFLKTLPRVGSFAMIGCRLSRERIPMFASLPENSYSFFSPSISENFEPNTMYRSLGSLFLYLCSSETSAVKNILI